MISGFGFIFGITSVDDKMISGRVRKYPFKIVSVPKN